MKSRRAKRETFQQIYTIMNLMPVYLLICNGMIESAGGGPTVNPQENQKNVHRSAV